MRKRRATDLKTNQRVYLPGARPAKEEAEMMVRKEVIINEVKKYIVKKCREDGQQVESNLTAKERRGMKKLRTRVKNGQIVITTTDKSSKLCVSTSVGHYIIGYPILSCFYPILCFLYYILLFSFLYYIQFSPSYIQTMCRTILFC